MTLRVTLLAAALLALALAPAAPAAAAAPPATAPAPCVAQFLAGLQPASAPTPPALAPLSPLSGAIATAGCGCLTQHAQCCTSCSGNSFCSGNAGCKTLCGDELQQCNCACLGTC